MRVLKESIFESPRAKPACDRRGFCDGGHKYRAGPPGASTHNQRLLTITAPVLASLHAGTGFLPGIQETIRNVIREEVRKLLLAGGRPVFLLRRSSTR